MTLRPYQQEGVEFLLSHRRALLGDDMGLGKTPQAAVALHALLGHTEMALVICPASLKGNWLRELNTWAPSLKAQVFDSKTDRLEPGTNVVIINYDILKKFHAPLRRVNWKVVICDEAHYMKTLDSQRTVQIRGGFGCSPIPADVRWAITGTPLLNRPIEFYPILKWLEVPWAQKFHLFGLRYCGAYNDGGGWDYRGASNLPELREKLKDVMLRRLKPDVLTDLPAKTRQIVELELDAAGRAALVEEQNTIAAKFPGLGFEELVAQISSLGLGGMELGEIAKLRKSTALSKVRVAAEYISSVLTSVDKVIVFGYHKEVIEGLTTLVHNQSLYPIDYSVTITGDTPVHKRQGLVDDFQNDPCCRVFFGNIQAAGVGLTLTAASLVIFVEEDWVPGVITQAEDRAHRIGQKDNVLVQHLVLPKSLDAYMAQSQIEKQKILDQILN